MIFDIHTHIGRWDKNIKFSKEDLMNVLDKNAVNYFCVSNLDGIGINLDKPNNTPFWDETECNKRLLKTFKDSPKALLLAVCEPRHGNAENISLLLRRHKNKFAGLKFHPEAGKIPANSQLYDDYMKLAKKYDLPCLIHSGDCKSHYSSPELIYELAKRHSDVRVILGHLSCGDINSKRIAGKIIQESVKEKNCKLYCDISWCDNEVLFALIKNIPIDRIMFGSDAPMITMSNPDIYNWFINDLMTMISLKFPNNADEIIAKIFYDNAKEFFKIK